MSHFPIAFRVWLSRNSLLKRMCKIKYSSILVETSGRNNNGNSGSSNRYNKVVFQNTQNYTRSGFIMIWNFNVFKNDIKSKPKLNSRLFVRYVPVVPPLSSKSLFCPSLPLWLQQQVRKTHCLCVILSQVIVCLFHSLYCVRVHAVFILVW